MTDFLFRLLQMSAAGSLLAGLIFLWRRFLRKEAVQAVFYYVWLLVLLRLCVPFGVTISMPVSEKAETRFGEISAANRQPGRSVSGNDDAAQPDPADTPRAPAALSAPDLPQKITRGFSEFFGGPMAWVLLWATGAAVCMGRYAAGYVRFAHALRKNASDASPGAWKVLDGFAWRGRVRLVECPFAATPMLVGLLRPVIVLPAGITEEQVLRDILAHELVHARRHDLLYKWFAAAVTSLHWFNPVMVLVRREIGRACELSCDEAVMRGMDEEKRQHYGETLLCLAASSAGPGQMAITLCEEKKQLKERLISIAAYRKKGVAAVIVSLFAAVFLSGCAMVYGVDLSQGDASGRDAGKTAFETSEPAADIAEDLPDNSSGEDVGQAPDLLREVLLGERQFLCMNTDSAPVSMYADDMAKVFSPDSEYAKIWQFAVVDLDGDGEEEAIVRVIDAAGDMGGCMVLHCVEGEVLGFAESYRAFVSLKTDGTFDASEGDKLDGVCRMRFAGNGYSRDWLAYCTLHTAKEPESQEFDYVVGGAPATEEEWAAALESQQKKEDVRHYSFSEKNVTALFSSEDHFSFVYTPDGQDGSATEEKEAIREPEYDANRHDSQSASKRVEDMYHFPVRVSDTRVLTVALESVGPEAEYFSVERILVYDGDTLIQTIETAELTPSEEYLWEGLFVNNGHREGEPDVRDVNFDGSEDFGLLCAAAYPKNLPFTYFFWDETEGGFVQGFTIFGNEALEVDEEQKCLIEHWYDVNGAHTTRYA